MRALVLAALAGCSFSPGSLRGGGDAGPGDDGGIDADIDAPDDGALCTMWTPAPKHFMPCAIAQPTGGLNITAAASPWRLDTTTGMVTNAGAETVTVAQMVITQTGGVEALVVSVDTLNVESGATLRVIGDKPLIIASFDSMTIAGIIDVGSKFSGGPGAGADPTTCSSSVPTSGQGASGGDDSDGGGGSGGGGGGAFRGGGGLGGPGDTTGGQNPGGAGGTALGAFPTIVRGGCAGGSSGLAGPSAGNPTARAAGGAGGGAIQLTARTSIVMTVGGRVIAGGSGGAGTASGDANGGGGGGSGGYIGLQAQTISITTAVVAANGGGGGGSNAFAGTGSPGQDGQPTAVAATGGAASGCSNAGGVGAAGSTLGGTSASQTIVSCGGGGGGGGAGFVGVFTSSFASSGSTISPAEQQNPF